MRDLDENTITQAVLERFAGTPDPRLRQVMQSLVRHLHDFIRDVQPSFEEWSVAIDFLTKTGQTCTDVRQEFILLSDTLGASMLVDAIAHRKPAGATQTTVLGPFYVEGPPELPAGTDIAAGLAGEPLYVEGVVRSVDGETLSGAIVDVWHSDGEGFYDVQRRDLPGPTMRARFHTDSAGRFHFWTITPNHYPIPDDGPVGRMLRATARHPFRPAHVHYLVSAPGYETLVTHVFAENDPYLDSDAVFGVKDSLVAPFRPHPPGSGPDGRVMVGAWRSLSYDFALSRKLSHNGTAPAV